VQCQCPLKVHVVAHTLGLPAEDGCVRPKALLKLTACQQIHPHNLQASGGKQGSLKGHIPLAMTVALQTGTETRKNRNVAMHPEVISTISQPHCICWVLTWSAGSDSCLHLTTMSMASLHPKA
jgi:hypothetical protein